MKKIILKKFCFKRRWKKIKDFVIKGGIFFLRIDKGILRMGNISPAI
jgi:hypothetical protein